MCDFISWIEAPSAHGGKQVWFLTHADIYESDKGARLREWSGSPDDYTGHGAIRYFFGMEWDQGQNRECTDFSRPDNFPPQIVAAIKAGEMRGMGVAPALLKAPAWAEYKRVEAPAWAEYKRVQDMAFWDLFAVPANRSEAWSEYQAGEEAEEEAP